MKLVNRGVVFRGEPGSDIQSAMSPGICALPGGRWLCGLRAAKQKNSNIQQAMLTWSDDQGQTWREPVSPWAVPELNGKPGSFRAVYPTAVEGDRLVATLCWVDASDLSLPFWHGESECLLDTRIFLSRSCDAGTTWSDPEYVDTYPITLCVPITGPILLPGNGDWACQFEINKPYGDTSVWRHASVMAFSGDQGSTWRLFSVVSNDPANRYFWWDQRPAVLTDGTILNVFWTLDNARGHYINIEACQSRDHGRTWSEMWDTGVAGQPGTPVALKDGTIAMPYVDRTAEPKIMLRCSADGGRTWPEHTQVELYSASTGSQQRSDKTTMDDQWAEMQAFSVGLPAAAALPDGDVLVVYYAGAETDVTGIEWVRLHPR